jgi:hypothetical protein
MSLPAKPAADLAAEFGLKPDEYALILERLGASPTWWSSASSR